MKEKLPFLFTKNHVDSWYGKFAMLVLPKKAATVIIVFCTALNILIKHAISTHEWFGLKSAIITATKEVAQGVQTLNCFVVRKNTHTAWVIHPKTKNVVKRHLVKHSALNVAVR